MARAKCIIAAFGDFGKARYPLERSYATELIFSACQYLVGVGLMTYVPNDGIFRKIDCVVERNSQFYDAEV